MDTIVPYVARVLEKIHYAAGRWHGVRVGVFRREDGTDVQVGEYERNYPSLLHTFAPFHAGGRDLALYSPDYTCTRLLELPSCRDIGGEEPDGEGFCPADFFVPHFIAPSGPLTYHPFGFVAGCIWGDDSSWKLQYLDLSEAAAGVLRREERFGYVELPDGLRLEKAIDLVDYQSDPIADYAQRIRITRTQRFDLRTGEVVDPLA